MSDHGFLVFFVVLDGLASPIDGFGEAAVGTDGAERDGGVCISETENNGIITFDDPLFIK